jgi:hydantoinase/carbamoylase family amidase
MHAAIARNNRAGGFRGDLRDVNCDASGRAAAIGPAMKHGQRILDRADALAAISEDPPGITRTYLTRQHREAGELIAGWMREAGLDVHWDALGNVVGRYPGEKADAPVLMTGSHMDSVRNAGRYDGLFGILSPIECIAELHMRGRRLPFAVEVVAFGDEEGVRFGVTLIGSRAMAGRFEPAWLDRTDAAGVTMRDALREFGGDPDAIAGLDRRGSSVIAFVESHIEQGPVLLERGLALGVVTSIAGGSRIRCRVAGLAGHAGTVPMGARQDALAAASEMVLAVERHCRDNPGLVGTVGRMSVLPGAVNVIPQDVEFTVDVRSGVDATRRAAVAALAVECRAIAGRRRVRLDYEPFFELDAAPCDEALQQRMAEAVAAQGLQVLRLPSGAGHDAMEFPAVCPIAMLFVRCGNGGISHHPSETMTAADAELATAALLHFVEHLR